MGLFAEITIQDQTAVSGAVAVGIMTFSWLVKQWFTRGNKTIDHGRKLENELIVELRGQVAYFKGELADRDEEIADLEQKLRECYDKNNGRKTSRQ